MSKLPFVCTENNPTEKNLTREEIKEFLQKQHSCYVLITCSNESKEGEMKVEMSYDGDEILASYLLESAQSAFKKPEDSCEY